MNVFDFDSATPANISPDQPAPRAGKFIPPALGAGHYDAHELPFHHNDFLRRLAGEPLFGFF